MAIYKKKLTVTSATTRQTIFWGIYGMLTGIYIFYPMLRATHRHEKSVIADWIIVNPNADKMKNKVEEE